jgi:coproporphyrinogen III oxidase-like Fe-S oxidoreductase
MQRRQNLADYRAYAARVLSGQSPLGSRENLTKEMKRAERIALSLRTREGIPTQELKHFERETNEFIALGLLRRSNGNLVLTRTGKSLADSVVEAFL